MITNIGVSTASPIVRVVDDVAHSFRRPNKRTLVAFLSKWGEEDRAALLKRLEDCGIVGQERFAEVKKHDESCREPYYGFVACGSLARAIEVIESSLGNPLPDDFPFDADATCGLAMQLWSEKTYDSIVKSAEERQRRAAAAADDGGDDDSFLEVDEMPTVTA